MIKNSERRFPKSLVVKDGAQKVNTITKKAKKKQVTSLRQTLLHCLGQP